MSTSIIEFIAANIETTIDGITTGNGYNQTLVGKRPKRIDFINETFTDKDVLILQKERTDADEEKPIQSSQYHQHFHLVASVLDSDASTDPIDTRINQVAADIVKALMVDPTRGGYAVDTMIHNSAMMEDESGINSGVVLDISVQYRTKYNDPYTQF